MKRLIFASLCALFLPSLALAQMTPNIGFNIPANNAPNWGTSLNSNFSLLDSLLSGVSPLPALNVTGPAVFPQLQTWQVSKTYSTGQVVAYLGTFYASVGSSNQGNLPTNATFWSTTIGSGGGGGTIPATALLLKGNGSAGVSVPAVPGTDYVIPSALAPLAPLANAALTGTPTAPTQGTCASNTNIATGAYVANCGTNLPTASAIGQVPTYTGAGTTATAQIPLGGTTTYYPVEWYGAVGNATGGAGVGTNNTTALQAAITALEAAGTCGQILLQPGKKYRITSALSITSSCVGIAGTSYGAWSTSTSNQLKASVPVSAIVIDSSTADAVDASGGSLSTPISFNKFTDFTILRTVAATASGSGCGAGAGPAGLSIQYAGGFVVDHVWSEDSACNFFFQNAGAYGTGSVENSGSMWGANGFNPSIPVYGFFVNGENSAESFRLRHSFSQTLYPGFSGVASVGFLATGSQLNDLMLDNFETSFQTEGIFLQYTGGGSFYSASDIHIDNCINDSDFVAGIEVSGLTSAVGGQVEISGGWDTSGVSGAKGIYILNSSGVTVSNVGFGQNGSQAFGVQSVGSSNLAITGNHFLNQGTAAIALGTTTDSAVTGNTISSVSGNATANFIQGTSLTYSSIIGNSIGGFCSTAGISLDSASDNNVLQNAIDPTNCSNTIANSGTGNQLSGSTSSAWPPSASGPTFSPVAGAVSSGTTVTTSCSGGSPYVSTGSTVVAGATGIAVSSSETLYGSCQGSGYFTTGSAGYTVSGGSIPAAIHKWPMNEGTGTTLHDTIGTTNLATTNVTWGVTSGLGSSAVAQFAASSPSFANAAAVDSTLNFSGTQAMSVGYWTVASVDNSGTVIGDLETSSAYQGWEAGSTGANGSASPALLVVGTVTTNQMTAVGSTATGTSANCIVTTYSGNLNASGVKIYINGTSQSVSDTTGTLTSGSTSTSPLYVGARNNGTSGYSGPIAYMSVWNVVLTPTQAASFCTLGPQ